VIGDANVAPDWPGAAWLVTLALTSQVVGWLLIITSLPRLPAALTSLLLTVQPVGSVALAALIFDESPTGLQLLGVLLVLTALIGATWSRRARAGAPARSQPALPVALAAARPPRRAPTLRERP
jgi:drug/metabolite transporter (DMT)-like permease